MDDFELEMKHTFLDEVQQTLENAEDALLRLDSGDTSKELLDEIFRLAHNFKGSAKAVGFDRLSTLAHKLEDALVKVKNGEVAPTKPVCNVLLRALDSLKAYAQGLKQNLGFEMDVTDLETQLMDIHQGRFVEAETPKPQAPSAPAPIAQVKPPAPVSKTQTPPAAPAPTTANHAGTRSEEESVRVNTRKLDVLLNLIGELVVNQSMMTNHRMNGTTASDHAVLTLSYMEKLVKEVQDISMSLRMVPVKPVFQKMRRTLRDVAQMQGKDIDFVTAGEHVELDKIVLERITDPLTHLIRNAVDHGIEPTSERVGLGKSPAARVVLEASHQEDRVVITVSDNGRGLNKEKLLKKALEKGLISRDEQLSDQEIYGLIFKPGFSTKEQVSDISGRGVGMDVVKRAVDELKGSIRVETALGQGTTFVISLPLSLSIISGMVVSIDQRKYVIPVSQLIETVEYQKLRVETSTGKGRMVNIRGEVIPVVSLGELLHGSAHSVQDRSHAVEETADTEELDSQPGVITEYQGKKISFEIDEIIGQQQIVLKRLGDEMGDLPGIIAGAILSSGEPGLILNLHDFVNKEGVYAAA